MPVGGLCRLEMDLQLVGGLGRLADDIHFQAGVSTLIQIHPDHEHHPVGHLDPELPAVGPKGSPGDGMAPQDRQTVGDAAKIVE
jgi:hypothetical protein